jgi:hypothetical protein
MKRRLSLIMIAVLALIVMTAALAVADEHAAQVSVGHGIPDMDLGMEENALPVDIVVDETCVVHDLEFGEFAGPLELEPGTYAVAVALSDDNSETCAGDVVIGPVDLTFEAGQNATVFAHLTEDGEAGPAEVDALGLGITATVFDNDVSSVVAGHTRLTVRHTAWAPAVDILLNRGWIRGREIAEFENLANSEETDPADLRPGAYAVSIFPAGEDEAVFQIPETQDDRPLVTHPHTSQIVYAVGSLENETFTVLVQAIDLGFTPPPHPGLLR